MAKTCTGDHTLDGEAQLKIWRHFQTNDPHIFKHSSARLGFIASQIGKHECVLNIGIGDGSFERLASFRSRSVYCVDPVSEAVSRVQPVLSSPDHAQVGSCEDLPFESAFFDVVVMSEVLEHLDEHTLQAGLTEVMRVLKPGGRFIGTVPADEDLEEQMVLCPHCGELFHRWGHVRAFSAETLTLMLSQIFQRPRVYRKVFVKWSELNHTGKIGALLRVIAFKLGRSVSNERFYFEAFVN